MIFQKGKLFLLDQLHTLKRVISDYLFRRDPISILIKVFSKHPLILNHLINWSYSKWIVRFEPDSCNFHKHDPISKPLHYAPLISIVIPVFYRDSSVFNSVQGLASQPYPNWEIIFITSEPLDPRWTENFNNLQVDSTKFTFIPSQDSLPGTLNQAILLSKGEFIVFLDQYDELSHNSLVETVQFINQNHAVDLIYSDHDYFDPSSKKRSNPHFKPDWSPELLISENYLGFFTIYKKNVLENVHGFLPTLDENLSWDLHLRCSESKIKIGHIPLILYHRSSSYLKNPNIKNMLQSDKSNLAFMKEHFRRLGRIQPEAWCEANQNIRVKWAVNQNKHVTIIIPTLGGNKLLQSCVDSILNNTRYPNYSIAIINNGPRTPNEFDYFNQIKSNSKITIQHYSGIFNYSKVNNAGLQISNTDYLLFLNNDTQVLQPDWLEELLMWVEDPEIGIAGARLLFPDNTIQHAGIILGMTGFAGHIFSKKKSEINSIFGSPLWYRNYLAVTGACLLIRSDLFKQIDGFNELLSLCGNDVDLCLKTHEAGYRIVYNPYVCLQHKEAATRTKAVPLNDYIVSFEIYKKYLKIGDPYFNPNLSYWDTFPQFKKKHEKLPHDFAKEYIASQDKEAHAQYP